MLNRITITVLFLFLFSVCQISTGQADGVISPQPERVREQSSKIRLSAKLQQDSVEAGQTVLLTLSLLNTSNERLTVESYRNAYDDYSFVVTDEEGKAVPQTAKMKTFILDDSIVSSHAHFLAPGQALECSICVNALFDMTLRGKYTITAKRILPIHQCPDGVTSNPEFVTITKPSAAYTIKEVK